MSPLRLCLLVLSPMRGVPLSEPVESAVGFLPAESDRASEGLDWFIGSASEAEGLAGLGALDSLAGGSQTCVESEGEVLATESV